MAEAVETRPLPVTIDPGMPDLSMYSEMPIPRTLIFDLESGPITRGEITVNPRTVNRPSAIPDAAAQRAFRQWVEHREEYFGHVPFCGAQAQFILDADYNPIMVNGYTAARWTAGGGSLVLGHTEWGSGWEVVTALNQYHGCFMTAIGAPGYSVHSDHVATSTPKDALLAHKQAVETVMKLSKFHGREAQPKQDVQVMLEPALSR